MIRYNNSRPADDGQTGETVPDGTVIIRHKNGDVEYLHPAKDDSRW